MSDDRLTRVKRIASEILRDQQIEAFAKGEDYYSFVLTDTDGVRSTLPPVWIDPKASDRQVRDKLSREFRQAFHPESDPGDLSVPNLQGEANQD